MTQSSRHDQQQLRVSLEKGRPLNQPFRAPPPTWATISALSRIGKRKPLRYPLSHPDDRQQDSGPVMIAQYPSYPPPRDLAEHHPPGGSCGQLFLSSALSRPLIIIQPKSSPASRSRRGGGGASPPGRERHALPPPGPTRMTGPDSTSCPLSSPKKKDGCHYRPRKNSRDFKDNFALPPLGVPPLVPPILLRVRAYRLSALTWYAPVFKALFSITLRGKLLHHEPR